MFEGLATRFSQEMLSISSGQLQCLPYSRAMLDFFDVRGKSAMPLVVRVVVFGQQNSLGWNELFGSIPGIAVALFKGASESPYANGTLQVELPSSESAPSKTIDLPYRTLGFPHGTAELGSYHTDGSWNGHLVVCVDNTLIDLTIGQINDSCFGITFSPPYVTIETDDGFLSGQSPLVIIQDGMLVVYRSYPEERTFEQSNSWGRNGRFRDQLLDFGKQFAEIVEGLSDSELRAEQLAAIAPARDTSQATRPRSERRQPSPRDDAQIRKQQGKKNRRKRK